MNVKLSAIKILLALSTTLLVGCSTRSHEAKYPNERPHSAAPLTDEVGAEHHEALGSAPHLSESQLESVKNPEKSHHPSVLGVKHYFGEEHSGVHGGPHDEQTP